MPIAPLAEFHSPHYLRHNQRRLEHLASLGLDARIVGRTVVDVGAGIGDHLSFYTDRGCKVTAVEGRLDNVQQLRELHPTVAAFCLDLNKAKPSDVGMLAGPFQVVHAYGLLYHLSNPAAFLDFARKATTDLLLLETCVSMGNESSLPTATEKASSPSQAIDGVGVRPTRPWLMAELRRRFPFVYTTRRQPFHPEFPRDWSKPTGNQPRAVFVASLTKVDSPELLTELPATHPVH